MFNKYDIPKVLHWLFALVLLIVIFTAIMNTTFYSKEAIMETFLFSFPNIELFNVGAADQLFIARMERRAGWVFHFWSGCLLFGIILARIFTAKNKTIFQWSVYLTMIVMFGTGIPLFIRVDVEIPMYIQNIARDIHFYSAWIFAVICTWHIVMVIYNENKNKSNKISKHFHFKKLSLIFLVAASLSTTDLLKASETKNHYELAMNYYTGKSGGVMISKVMPNCPYDNCQKADMMRKKMQIKEVNGESIFMVKKRDIKSALFFFEKSSFEDKEKRASSKALKILLGAINYKDKNTDAMLLKLLKKEFNLDIEQYKVKLKKILLSSYENRSCYGTFKYAQFIERDYLGLFKLKPNDSLLVYKDTFKVCPSTRMEKLMANSKIKQLSKEK